MGVNWFYTGEATERDEFGLRVRGFVMPITCSTIREGCDCVAEWQREGDDDGKGTRVVDKVNVSLAEAVSGGNSDVGRKLAGGCIGSRYSTSGATISSAWNETADCIPIHSD